MRHFVITGVLLASAFAAYGQSPSATTTAPVTSLGYVPLTQEQRFHRYLKSLVSLETLGRSAAGAGIDPIHKHALRVGSGREEDSPCRFGRSDHAQHVIRQTLMYGASAVLDEDNRYRKSERTGFGPRTLYAIEDTAACLYGTDGRMGRGTHFVFAGSAQ